MSTLITYAHERYKVAKKLPDMTLEEAKKAIEKACQKGRRFTSIEVLCKFVNGSRSAKKQLTPEQAVNAVRSMRLRGILIDSQTVIRLPPQ